MYAVIRKYQFDRAVSEELDRKIREFFVPQLKMVPGFVTYYWLESGEGTGASLSVFQDKTGAEESVRLAARFVEQHLAGLPVTSPEVTAGEVRAHG
ncbi:hypothetical protein D3C84_763100 [compost metagenome]